MAESKYFDLAQTIMIERYGLEEKTYRPLSFSESANSVSIKMTDDFIPVNAVFPMDFMEYERVRRMPVDELRATFVMYQPHWDKLSPDLRSLFDKVVGEYEEGALPQLKFMDHEEDLTEKEEDVNIQDVAPEDGPKPKRKVGKPTVKKESGGTKKPSRKISSRK